DCARRPRRRQRGSGPVPARACAARSRRRRPARRSSPSPCRHRSRGRVPGAGSSAAGRARARTRPPAAASGPAGRGSPGRARRRPTRWSRTPGWSRADLRLAGLAACLHAQHFVHGVEVGARAGLDDVRGYAAAADLHAAGVELDDHVTERVDAAGDRRDVEVREGRVDTGGSLDGLARGVDHAVALGGGFLLLAAACDDDARPRFGDGAAADLELFERVRLLDARAELLGHDRLEVGVGEFDLTIGQFLETGERRVQGVTLEGEAHLLELGRESVAAGVLAEDDLAALLADLGGVDDLVGRALGQHAVLVNAGLVGEGVSSHDRLVVLDRITSEAADEAARAGQLLRVHLRVEAVELVGADLQRHGDFLERGVAGALAEAVDADLHLAGAVLDAGE